jgi:hypothetical protein
MSTFYLFQFYRLKVWKSLDTVLQNLSLLKNCILNKSDRMPKKLFELKGKVDMDTGKNTI